MLKKEMVRRKEKRFLFFFFYFFSRVGPVIYENASILLRVGALLVYFVFLLIKIAESGVWNRVGRVSGNTAIFLRLIDHDY